MNIVSLFAGCGGLDLGFEKAGFNIVWANEYDKSVHETYRLNHPNTILNTSDIRTLSSLDIPDCDGIIGGPPCQAWSEGGKRLGIEDPRGQLFLDCIRIVKDKQPKFFVIENVQGILEDKHKDSLNCFITLLKEAAYRVSYELLNAADYKVPQDRFRVFFIGIRNDLKNKFQFPDAVSKKTITLRQAIGDIVEEPRYYKDEPVLEVNSRLANHDTYIGAYDSKYMARNRVRAWNETSFTMQAQARNAPQHPQAPKMTYVSANQRIFAKGYEHLYRRLSVRECARIQTFPDWFVFKYSNVKDGYKMVGNAVPPRLAWYLANQMKQAFSSLKESNDNRKLANFQRIKQIPVNKIATQYSRNIINNSIVRDYTNLDLEKHVLISLVSQKNTAAFLDMSAKLYYTGKTFPSTIHFNKLFYFMPYIKGNGVKDLYLIKAVRVGSKQEVHPECLDNDFRIVFEIDFIKHLFNGYKPIHLNIWHTFTDTILSDLLKLTEVEEFD
jgi:DNA (cytosine-5)-methyltransferase 1